MPDDDDTIVPRALFRLAQPYAEPRNDTERTLAEIWRKALGMDQVGIEDSYFDLGGDSLLAAMIFAETETAFGIKIPMAILTETPTIALLAPKIDELLGGPS